MAFGKKSAIKAANREDDKLEDRRDERAEDREESAKASVPAPTPAPVSTKGEPQFYPKWVKLGDIPVVVANAAQEKAVAAGTAKVEVVKSAQGDQIKIV